MKLNDYQQEALKTAVYPREYSTVYPACRILCNRGHGRRRHTYHIYNSYSNSVPFLTLKLYYIGLQKSAVSLFAQQHNHL